MPVDPTLDAVLRSEPDGLTRANGRLADLERRVDRLTAMRPQLHYFGSETALLNGWTPVSGSGRNAPCWYVQDGHLHLEGLITGGTGQVFAVLPFGPASQDGTSNTANRAAVEANSAMGSIGWRANGELVLVVGFIVGTNTNLFLDNVRWRV